MKTIAPFLLLFIANLALGQDKTPGAVFINAGIGATSWGIPLVADIELPVIDNLSLSLTGSIQRNREEYTVDAIDLEYLHTIVGVGGSFNYYLDEAFPEAIPEEVDVFVSLQGMYYFWNTESQNISLGVPDIYRGSGGGTIGISLLGGGRYHLPNNDNLSIHFVAGLGSAWSIVRMGVSIAL